MDSVVVIECPQQEVVVQQQPPIEPTVNVSSSQNETIIREEPPIEPLVQVITGPEWISANKTLVETNPIFTWSSGKVTRIDYLSGNYKTFTYNASGILTQSDYIIGATTTRKIFTYNADGALSYITQTQF